MEQQKRILICPLDWGLGHATRCIPIIRALLKEDAKVIIAADGRPLSLLREEFPDLEYVILKGYPVRYPEKGSMIFRMLISVPAILQGIRNEHLALQKIVEKHRIDIVISDNRFGCYSPMAKNIFITHQLEIQTPFAINTLRKLNLYYIGKYHECWVPDDEGTDNLSGRLSHLSSMPPNVFFIGPVSRFEPGTETLPSVYDVMAIVSGPEPQRGIFENLMREELKKVNLKTLLVCGTPEKKEIVQEGDLKVVPHLPAKEMQEAIARSGIIIARSGYSTILDLAVLGKKAIFIPTPGQTEQEYLAKKLEKKEIAGYSEQKKFRLEEGLEKTVDYKGFLRRPVGNDLLQKRIRHLLRLS